MKKYFISFLCIGLGAIFFSSCVKYLDKSPESTFTEQDVFSKYVNFKQYFDGVYNGTYAGTEWNIKQGYPLYFSFWDRKFSWEALTDMSDAGRMRENQIIKSGLMGSLVDYFTYESAISSVTGNQRPILGASFSVIRKCNMALEKIHLLTDADQQTIDDFKAQAHFARAFAHFTLFKVWGPMPYITKVLGPDDQWDIPRLSNHETLMHIAADLDTALTLFSGAGLMRRDNPVVGGAGHLNSPDQFRPTGVAAKALRARVLLYAASPLNNENGVTDWQDAAKANWEAIQTAEQNGYFLLTAANYKFNFIGSNYSDEEIWAWAAGGQSYSAAYLRGQMNGIFGASTTVSSGECPTQNFVDRFETAQGEPLNTDADRTNAINAGHYKDQDPYANRDPRFYIDIIYNEATISGYGTAKIYRQTVTPIYSELLDPAYAGITHTGYYQRKYWGEQSTLNRISPLYTDPLIRLTELYLNYAEAANEAYGPNTPAPGASLTAVQAINKIRNRINMPNVLATYTTDKDTFRPRLKNERDVELCFEGHYYFDIRRWKDAPAAMAGPLWGMDILKTTVSTQYPRGYIHTRMLLPAERQSHWKDAMYYFPFGTNDNYKIKNFTPNPLW
jgi:hypothetical protein